MASPEKPSDFVETMRLARAVTDPRPEFDIYFEVSRRVVRVKLSEALKGLPISEEHKKQVIEAEAYSKAQRAHLSDAASYKPTNLLALLGEMGLFDSNEPAVPFRQMVEERLNSEAPDLVEKWQPKLDDPMMQTALWSILDVMEARKRADEVL